jgi:Protein of unknown function (DUF1236)
MTKSLLGVVTSAALLFSTGIVSAQAVFEITPQQELSVYTNIYGQRVVTETAPQFDVTVGAVLPGEVQIYEVPAAVDYAPVQQYRYVTVGNRVVLVEPASRRVVRVIAPPNEVQRDKVIQ